MKPALAQFEGEFKGKIKVVRVNLDNQGSPEFRQYARYFDVNGIPYTIILDGTGRVLKKKLGGMSLDGLRKFATQ
jgi:thioredoxin-like negative regulator of GroEL